MIDAEHRTKENLPRHAKARRCRWFERPDFEYPRSSRGGNALMARWFVQRPGMAPVGPIHASELHAAWTRGEIAPDTVVCAEGFARWVPFGEVGELVGPARVVPTPNAKVSSSHRPTSADGTAKALFEKVPARAVAIVVGGGLLLSGSVFAYDVVSDHAYHARVAAALSSTNPCDIEKVSSEIDTRGTDDEKMKREGAKSACEQIRYENMCDVVMAHIDADTVTEDDVSRLGDQSGVVLRIARHQLIPRDLQLSQHDLPCETKLWPRLIREISDSTAVWTPMTFTSTDVKSAFVNRALGSTAQTALLANVNAAIASALKGTSTSDMESGRSCCSLAATFHVPSIGCDTLERRYAVLNAREEAAEKAKSAREEAATRAEEGRAQAREAESQRSGLSR